MLRRIVLTRSHEPLGEAFRTRSFGPAGAILEQAVKVRGMDFDESLHPVRIFGGPALRVARPSAAGFNYGGLHDSSGPRVYAMRADFQDQDAIERLRSDKKDEVVGVFADPAILPCPTYCGSGPAGDHHDVARVLGVSALRKAGLSGRKVRSGALLDLALSALGSRPALLAYEPNDHETDVLIAAAGLRSIAEDAQYWRPAGLTPAVARGEGWTFGVL